MRSRSFIAVAAVVVALLVVAGGVYAYDLGSRDRIARGVLVGGIDVGGLDRRAARDVLHRSLLAPLNRPVRVTARGRSWTLTPGEARVGVDVEGSLEAAIRRSRRGNPVSRALRELTGGAVHAEVPVRISFDRGAVAALVTKVRAGLERPARDADIDLAHGSLARHSERAGRRLQVARLRRELSARLLARSGPRTVRAHTVYVAPKVTSEQLGAKYPAIIIINRKSFSLRLYRHLKLVKRYGIAVGRAGLETPAGLYHIQDKQTNPSWHVPNSAWAGKLRGKVIPPDDPKNPIKARWMGIYDGAGIHGTTEDNSIGSAASHGCIRMHIPDVVELFDRVSTGDPVYIS